MKINYRNTALHFLDDPKNIVFNVPANRKYRHEEDKRIFGKAMTIAFSKSLSSPLYRKKIQYITNPFHEAFYKNKSKLTEVFDKMNFNTCGVLLYSKGSWTTTCFYMIYTEGHGEDWKVRLSLTYFSKHAQNDFFSLEALIIVDDFNPDDNPVFFLSQAYEDIGLNQVSLESEIIGLLTFLKYCPMETKVINRASRGYHTGEKYVNETKHDVEILDSSWFTTIVRTEGFGVTGHLRWQPCGPGRREVKLIYVEPFEKQGYTRTAKIARNED